MVVILMPNFSFGQVILSQDKSISVRGLVKKVRNGLGNTTLHRDGYACDFFLLNLMQYLDTTQVYISKRYSKLLFSSINSNIRWDGTLNGEKLPMTDYLE